MHELDPRKQTILRAIVFEYVSGAEPVASEQLVHKYQLGVKSATVRNEMAEMSELGYLEQPHTSAGRIPSDQGYRYFVDRLIVQREPELAAKKRLKDAAEEGDALQELLRDTTRVLSRLTHQLSAATVVRDSALTC
jgi:heat-inducible transcriptional repressor